MEGIMSLKGTRTEKNLLTSFAGESQARMRYNYFAPKVVWPAVKLVMPTARV